MKSRHAILKVTIVAVSTAICVTGCATQSPTLFQSWGGQLHHAPAAGKTVDDVSLLLGAPPSKCDPIEAIPSIGINIRNDAPVIDSIRPGGAAAIAGMQSGDKILSVAGISVTTSPDVVNAVRNAVAWETPFSVQTSRQTYSLIVHKPTSAVQCYWDIQSGAVAQAGGAATVNAQRGIAMQGGSAYQRFFRASCRFYDGKAIGCQANWQE